MAVMVVSMQWHYPALGSMITDTDTGVLTAVRCLLATALLASQCQHKNTLRLCTALASPHLSQSRPCQAVLSAGLANKHPLPLTPGLLERGGGGVLVSGGGTFSLQERNFREQR